MPDRAHVTSVDALESFRSTLIIYLSKARPTLEEVSADVTRTKLWLENDQRVALEGLLRRRMKVLEQAQQALFSTRVSNLREESAAELMAVQKAKRAVDETETKLRTLKKWNREFDSHVDPLVKELGKLHTFLMTDMTQAVAYLAQAVKTLDAYAGIVAPSVTTGSTPPPGAPKAGEGAGVSPGSAGSPAPGAGPQGGSEGGKP